MSYSNEQLSNELKNNKTIDLSSVISMANEIINSGTKLSSTNEQLIVAKFDLANIGQLNRILKGESFGSFKNTSSIGVDKIDAKINVNKIIEAGQSLKTLYLCILFNFIIVLFTALYFIITKELNKNVLIFTSLASFVLVIIEIISISSAGDNLINCQKED